ncbi:MAG: hypothetical protein NVV62_12735 [Terricaulis sp.]|nr:hypothetical protein [Terricaulis sp.]
MAQPRPTRLYETPKRTAQSAEVIDVQFKVVKRPRPMLASFGRWSLAFFAAAIIGLLIPPVWVLAQEIAAMLGGR